MQLRAATATILALGLLSGAWSQADYPGAAWVQAYSGNYGTSNRPTTFAINYVVIHIMEGTYNGTISWFQNPSAGVSAHYCMRSTDGAVTQMVREKDRAFHAGVTLYNNEGVGIEHEGFSSDPATWYTDTQYRASATLTRYLCSKYGITRDRTHILGHKETGRATSCPGPWDWTKYMAYVNGSAAYDSDTVPSAMIPGSNLEVVVNMKNDGLDQWLSTGTDQVQIRTTPTGRVSSFYTAGDWASTQIPCHVTANTAANGIGEFRFQMTAPTTVGTYTETFQLYKSSIGYFGPVLTFQIEVGQLDTVYDNTTTSFTVSGNWFTRAIETDKYGSDYRYHSALSKSKDYALWNLNVPADGLYDVYAWWSAGSNRTTKGVFELLDPYEGAITRIVDQTQNGGKWNYLGRMHCPAGAGGVKLYAQSKDNINKLVCADAIRAVGPY